MTKENISLAGEVFNPEAIVLREQDAWKKVLGSEVIVKHYPEFITPEVDKRLEAHGLHMVYMPEIKIDAQRLQSRRHWYVEEIQELYPRWTLFSEYWWDDAAYSRAETFKMPGYWLALEKDQNNHRMNKLIGYPHGRSTVHLLANGIHNIDTFTSSVSVKVIDKILGQAVPKETSVRLPTLVELSLLASRFGWSPETATWTATHGIRIRKETDYGPHGVRGWWDVAGDRENYLFRGNDGMFSHPVMGSFDGGLVSKHELLATFSLCIDFHNLEPLIPLSDVKKGEHMGWEANGISNRPDYHDHNND